MDLYSEFTPNTPPMLDKHAKEVSKILNALQDYVFKVAEHLSEVAIGEKCKDDMDAKDATRNAITCKKLLPMFRSIHSEKGFNVADHHFQNILGSLALLPEQIKRHLIYCTLVTHSYREMLSVFEYNITRMKEISQTPAMYKEPFFLPVYSSTPNMSARESINSTSTEAELNNLVKNIIATLGPKKSCPICQNNFTRSFNLKTHIE
jgi:hypothetical protein